MDKRLIYKVLDMIYDNVERVSNSNGYESNHVILTDKTTTNVIKYVVLNEDNQGEHWCDVYKYTSTVDGKSFVACNATHDIKFTDESAIGDLKSFISYVLSNVFKSNDGEPQLTGEILRKYLDAEHLQSEIDKAITKSNDAYSAYMYEEAAERGYDAKASHEAFGEYTKYKNYVCSLLAIQDELKNNL